MKKVFLCVTLAALKLLTVMTGCRTQSAGSGGYPSIDFPNPAAQLCDDDSTAPAKQHVDTLKLDK